MATPPEFEAQTPNCITTEYDVRKNAREEGLERRRPANSLGTLAVIAGTSRPLQQDRFRPNCFEQEDSAMSGEWPMFILQCVVVIGLVGALFIRAD